MFASDDSVWEDCRKALRAAIREKFNRTISGTEWITVIPSADPTKGGFNSEVRKWLTTLERAREILQDSGYVLGDITAEEAADAVDQRLTSSIGLLYGKITTRREAFSARLQASA